MNGFNQKSFIYLFVALVFIAIGGIFIYQVYLTSDPLFYAPAGVGLIGVIVFAFLFIKETFIGKHQYKIVKGTLIVTRHGRTVCVAERDDIYDLVYVYSFGTFSDELHYVCFTAGNRRFYANVLSGENAHLCKYFKGMDHKDSRNILFYLIEPFAA